MMSDDDWRGTGEGQDVSPKVKICYVYFRYHSLGKNRGVGGLCVGQKFF